jgi:L-2-hydroxyglutarate oxidase LhgO
VRGVDFLLIGGGMGSAYCASELRRRGAEGSVLLVGREQDPALFRQELS